MNPALWWGSCNITKRHLIGIYFPFFSNVVASPQWTWREQISRNKICWLQLQSYAQMFRKMVPRFGDYTGDSTVIVSLREFTMTTYTFDVKTNSSLNTNSSQWDSWTTYTFGVKTNSSQWNNETVGQFYVPSCWSPLEFVSLHSKGFSTFAGFVSILKPYLQLETFTSFGKILSERFLSIWKVSAFGKILSFRMTRAIVYRRSPLEWFLYIRKVYLHLQGFSQF